MKFWQLIVIFALFIFASLNPKIQLHKVFLSQLKVYTNDKTGKIYWFDIVTFILIPIVVSVFVGLQLPISTVSKYSDTVITIFSLIATVLLSFVAILSDKDFEKQNRKEIVKETIITINLNTIYSMLVVSLVVLPKLIALSLIFKKIVFITIIFLIVKIAFNMLMILKRVSKILEF